MTKKHFSSLGELIAHCTKNNYPFALYRLPGEKQIHCIAHCSVVARLVQGLPFPSAPGFVFYPFVPGKSASAYFIGADVHFSCLHRDVTSKDISGDYRFDVQPDTNVETPLELYCGKVQEAVDAIKAGKLKKVTLSRVQTVAGAHRQPLPLFIDLCGMFGSAFLSLVYIPGKTLWLTVSPELLISSNKEEIRTVALAGTRSQMKNWTEKEFREQQLVTDFVKKVIEKHCSRIRISPPADVVAGSIVHLKTSITAQLDSGLWDLVMDLHPTPAVCGIPKEEALNFIAKTELHDRKYYSGFLGPNNIDGETGFYVNLRCAELLPDKANLYIGGGITADSSPNAEWEETVMKASTLLPLLNPALNLKVAN